MVSKKPTCKDCLADGLPLTRKALYPGSRCATHHRQRIKMNRETARGRRLIKVYSITAEEYARILAVQNGSCFICVRAKGARRSLSVDHDHAQALLDGHEADKGCPNCVRGLLCQPCNRLLGHLRDDPEAFERAASYLRDWPSKR